MKKFLTVASLVALAVTVNIHDARADYRPEGLFGGRATPDGALNVRTPVSTPFNPIRGQSVADRPRPDFDPTPIDIGSFQLFPTISAGAYYDSNIYATDTGTKSDLVGKVNPSASLLSNWGRNAIGLTALGDFNIYSDHSKETNYNGALQADGRYDIAAQTYLAGKASYQRATEPRGNPSNPGSLAEPVSFGLGDVGVSAHRSPGKLSLDAGYDAKFYNYDNPDLTTGGKLNLTGRDRTQQLFNSEVGYEVTGNFHPFVRGVFDKRDYTNNTFRGSDGFRVDLGTRSDFGGIVTGELYAGYLEQDYDFANGDINTLDFGGDVTWNVTALTSIEAEVARTVEETTVGGIATAAGASGYLSTAGSLTVTHELLRNVLVEAHGTLADNAYGNSSRDDTVYGAGIGTRYFINRNFFLDGTYDYTNRDSNVAGGDYEKHIVFARIGAQY